jgi:hypothetical protein
MLEILHHGRTVLHEALGASVEADGDTATA